MKIVIYILCLILFSACNTKGKPDTTIDENVIVSSIYETIEPIIEIPEISFDYINLAYSTDSNRIWVQNEDANNEKLKLILISEDEYLNYDSTYNKLNKLLSFESDSIFRIKVKNEEWTFKKEINLNYGNRGGEDWSEYIGYYPDLGLYAIRACTVSGDSHGFADLYLIDSLDTQMYIIPAAADYCEATPILSPNNKYMALVDNDYDPDEGYMKYVSIVKINDKNDPKTYFSSIKESELLDFNNMHVNWINDNEFLIKASKMRWVEGKEVTNITYYKVALE